MAMFGIVGTPAASSACGQGQHCYGIAIGQNPYGDHGSYASLCETALSVTNPATNFVTDESWLVYDHDNPADHWTETGMIYGRGSASAGFFWADQNSKYGFNFHYFPGGPSSGAHYDAYLFYQSQPWWEVYLDGNVGWSWHNGSTAVVLETGTELWNGDGLAAPSESGASRNLAWFDTNDNAHSGWAYTSQQVDDPWQGFWYMPSTYWSEKTADQGWSC